MILEQGEGVQVCVNLSEEEEPPESMEFSHWSKEGTQFIVPILRHSFFFPLHNKELYLFSQGLPM